MRGCAASTLDLLLLGGLNGERGKCTVLPCIALKEWKKQKQNICIMSYWPGLAALMDELGRCTGIETVRKSNTSRRYSFFCRLPVLFR
jgi:hypothetical protein